MEEEEGEDEEMGVAETYADYWPAKCKKLEITATAGIADHDSFGFSKNR
jgi:hypothetical protein